MEQPNFDDKHETDLHEIIEHIPNPDIELITQRIEAKYPRASQETKDRLAHILPETIFGFSKRKQVWFTQKDDKTYLEAVASNGQLLCMDFESFCYYLGLDEATVSNSSDTAA